MHGQGSPDLLPTGIRVSRDRGVLVFEQRSFLSIPMRSGGSQQRGSLLLRLFKGEKEEKTKVQYDISGMKSEQKGAIRGVLFTLTASQNKPWPFFSYEALRE